MRVEGALDVGRSGSQRNVAQVGVFVLHPRFGARCACYGLGVGLALLNGVQVRFLRLPNLRCFVRKLKQPVIRRQILRFSKCSGYSLLFPKLAILIIFVVASWATVGEPEGFDEEFDFHISAWQKLFDGNLVKQ